MKRLIAEPKTLIRIVERVDFSMTEAELTLEERKHLYNMVAMVFLVTLAAFGFPMLFYLKPPEPFPQGILDFFVWYGIPYSAIGPISLFLPYEVFYPKRARKSRSFHAKRFARHSSIGIAAMLSLFTTISFSDVTFSKTLGDNAIFPGILMFSFVFVIAVFLWLRRHRIEL